MKWYPQMLSSAGSVFVALLTGAAHGGGSESTFSGLALEVHARYTCGYDVYRLYAEFTAPATIVYWGGDPDSPFEIENIAVHPVMPGSGFYAHPFSADILPQPAGNLYDAYQEGFDYSTYMTLGVEPGYDVSELKYFQLTPTFDPNFIGEPIITGEGGVHINPPAMTDEDHRILLGQFTVQKGELVRGEDIWIAARNSDEEPFVVIAEFKADFDAYCPATNINKDMTIDGQDLLLVLSAWGEAPEPDTSPCNTDPDINKDGFVDGDDLLLLLCDWGTTFDLYGCTGCGPLP